MWVPLLCAALVVLWLVPSNPMLALIEFRDLEYRRSRARLNAQPLQPPDPRILIVGIDDEVFAQQRFNRVEHARLLDRLCEAGARSVFLDLLFEEPRQPEVDQQLLEALKRSRRAIVGAAYRLDLDSATHQVQSPLLMDPLLESLRRRDCLAGILNASQSESRSEFTLIFQDLSDDPDWAGLQPSPAVTILTQLFRLQAADLSIHPGSRWQGPILTIPPVRLEAQQLDRGRLQLYQVPVRFRPPVTGPQAVAPGPLTFPKLPYLALADGDPQALSQVKGKIVLVGETTSGDDDIIDTPVGRMKGVEGHANVLDSLLSGRLPHFTDTHQRLGLASKIFTLVFCYALASLLVRQPDLVRWTLVTLLGFVGWEALILKADSLGYFLDQTQGETSLALTALIAHLVMARATLHLHKARARAGGLHILLGRPRARSHLDALGSGSLGAHSLGSGTRTGLLLHLLVAVAAGRDGLLAGATSRGGLLHRMLTVALQCDLLATGSARAGLLLNLGRGVAFDPHVLAAFAAGGGLHHPFLTIADHRGALGGVAASRFLAHRARAIALDLGQLGVASAVGLLHHLVGSVTANAGALQVVAAPTALQHLMMTVALNVGVQIVVALTSQLSYLRRTRRGGGRQRVLSLPPLLVDTGKALASAGVELGATPALAALFNGPTGSVAMPGRRLGAPRVVGSRGAIAVGPVGGGGGLIERGPRIGQGRHRKHRRRLHHGHQAQLVLHHLQHRHHQPHLHTHLPTGSGLRKGHALRGHQSGREARLIGVTRPVKGRDTAPGRGAVDAKLHRVVADHQNLLAFQHSKEGSEKRAGKRLPEC